MEIDVFSFSDFTVKYNSMKSLTMYSNKQHSLIYQLIRTESIDKQIKAKYL